MKKISLRPARPSDMPLIQAFHTEQNKRDGTSYPLPQFFDKVGAGTQQVPVSLVGVREGSDAPVQAIWVERRAELMFAGCDPKATAFARREIDALASLLKWLGYSGLHCEVPIALECAISKPLGAAGFQPNNRELAHFFKDLRGESK